MIKMPKDWKKWCKKHKLRPHCGAGGRSKANRGGAYAQWIYLKGRGYVWRVNCYGNFQRGDSHEEFDRWALCNIDETPMPKNEKQFDNSIEWLLDCAKTAKESK